jgi:uncharacterized protein YndB with AHSA1/START domain
MTDRNGRLTVDGDQAVLHFERKLPFSVEHVWAAITDPGHRDKWMGKTSIEPWQGGLITTVASGPPLPPDQKRMTGRILVWDPPRVFEHEWNQPIVEPGVVRYELHSDGAGTLLRFSHRGLSVPNATGFRSGTHAFLDRLEALLADEPMPNWAQRYEAIAGAAPSAPRRELP